MEECKETENNYQEECIKNISPQGLTKALEHELENSLKELDYFTRKCNALKQSIEKLK